MPYGRHTISLEMRLSLTPSAFLCRGAEPHWAYGKTLLTTICQPCDSVLRGHFHCLLNAGEYFGDLFDADFTSGLLCVLYAPSYIIIV
jgi:hypothetical protein